MARGISNAQAKFLGRLCRELGVPYSGSGMTREQATHAIDTLIPLRDAQRAAYEATAREATKESVTTA
jgi:uncharacterized protein YqjF (DUF2071 family)